MKAKAAPKFPTAKLDVSKKPREWSVWMLLAAAFVLALIAYSPAIPGAFVFDDVHMPFFKPNAAALPFGEWLGSRPLVGFSYWVNYQMGGASPIGYHVTNIFLHAIVACLVFLIVRKILELASAPLRKDVIALVCASLFLLHPVQTEAVAYVSSRSEDLSVALAFAAWALFLYRSDPDISLQRAFAIVLLYAAAATAKEHVAVLPVVLLLTDYYWNPGFSLAGAKRNWKLYGLLTAGAIGVLAFLYSYLSKEATVGFGMKTTAVQYLFTQCRVLFLYARLFVLPFGQNADYGIAISQTPLDQGAIFFMAAILALMVLAVVWRKRFPVATFGFWVAAIFFAPTSSFIPIRDVAAERRLYLPMIGILLIVAEVLSRMALRKQLTGILAAVVLICGVLTWNRSQVYATPLALWQDTVEKSPNNRRAHLGLAAAALQAGRFPVAAREYELAGHPDSPTDGIFYSDWGLALDGAGRLNEAVEKGKKGVEVQPGAPTYCIYAMFVAKAGRVDEAFDILNKAQKADPSYVPTYIEGGDLLLALGKAEAARAAFQQALKLDPSNAAASRGLTASFGRGAK